MWRLLLQMWHKCATADSSTFLDIFDSLNGRKYMAQNPELNGVCCFRARNSESEVRKASKDRGFRSEQAFILAACEREIRRGDDD